MLVMPAPRADGGLVCRAPSSRTLKRSSPRALPSSLTTMRRTPVRVLERVLQRLEDAKYTALSSSGA